MSDVSETLKERGKEYGPFIAQAAIAQTLKKAVRACPNWPKLKSDQREAIDHIMIKLSRILNGNPGSPHGGADFPAVTGTPVHAAQRGNVALAEELFFSGNTVVLDHGLGIYTFYGHLSEIDVKAGDALEAGAVLGKVGATGRVTGPHLHWGLTVERARVNPLLLVKLLGNSPEVPARKRSLKRRTR